MPTTGWFFWVFTASIYKIFTLGAAYNKDLWILFVKIMPAVFGALISVSMYFFGKETYNEKAGVVMAFFAALVPSFVYRTMSGFFEEDSLGFLWLVIGFVFLAKALKEPELTKQKIIYAVAAGLFFSVMALTWEMFLLIPMVLGGFLLFTLIIMWFRKVEKQAVVSFLALFFLMFIIFGTVATINDGGTWAWRSYDYVRSYLPISQENVDRLGSKGEGILAQTVGEENTGKQFFGIKYNALIIFPLLAFFLIPYRLLKNKRDWLSLIILFWAGITFFMAWNKLKFTYTLGLPIAACGGIVFLEAFNLLRRRGPNMLESKLFALSLAFMLLIGVGAGTFFVTQKVPSIEEFDGWKEALYWMEANTPKDAKFFNWWDEGHWITFIGERGVIEDNRNLDLNADIDFGKFALAETEEEAYALVQKYGSTHLILDEETITKQHSLSAYAYNTTNFADPRLNRHYAVMFNCSNETNQLTGAKTYTCGSNIFDEQTMDAIPSVWTSTPSQVEAGRMPLFVYKKENKSKLYILNAAANKTVVAKLLFNDPSITHFEEAYANSGVRIYKIE
jgi:asparagine N-glycosylation enzyme membrane subunit Stt3